MDTHRLTLIGIGTAALAAVPIAAQAQTISTASTEIVEPSPVSVVNANVLMIGPNMLALTQSGLTFSVSSNPNGNVAVAVPGLVGTSQAGGTIIPAGGEKQFLTGTTLASEALSISIGGRVRFDRPAGLTVLLVHYN